MRSEYKSILSEGLIVPYTQSLLIANGMYVPVTGKLDTETKNAINKFKKKHNIRVGFPHFKIHKALEINRLLDVLVAHRAWDAYHMFKDPDAHLH